MTVRHFKIGQGGLVFDIRAERRHAWIIRELENRWQAFVTTAAPVDVDVIITCYDFKNVFNWPADQLEPFTRAFLKVRDRFPFNNCGGAAALPPDGILARLDPDNRTVKRTADRLRQDRKVVFANTATGLFIFDPAQRKLFIFTGSAPSPFPLLSRIYSKPSPGKALLMADILNGIMLASAWLLVRDGSLLLHGAGVCKSSYAVLFLGLSEAGKSTVARKCEAEACFSDDGVIVKKNDDEITIYPSIFTQAPHRRRRPLPHPTKLRKLFLLNKSDQDRVSPLDKNRLANHILLHLIHFFRYFDKKTAKRAFENTLAFVGALPVGRFDFTKDRQEWSDVWQAPEKRKSTNHRL